MADGEVIFHVGADDKEAQKKLAQLRRDIERTQKALQTSETKHNAISDALADARAEAQKTADTIKEIKAQMSENSQTLSGNGANVDADEFAARQQAQKELQHELNINEKLYDKQSATVKKLEGQEKAVLTTIQQQTAQLETQQAEAGAVERNLAKQSGETMPQLKASTEDASKAFKKGLKSILKWGFGIRSTFILMRRLRSAIKEGISELAKQDAETKQSVLGLKTALATLKGSWAAAFAPIVNAVAPYLQTLIGWLTKAANSVQMFIAVLAGRGTYKKATANIDKLTQAMDAAGGAAAEAKKQIMGFDEINQLTDNKGGGGGGSDFSYTEEEIDMMSFPARMALMMKDVFFNWSDLTAEDIAAKALAAFTGLGGAIAGGMIGGVPGAIIGLTAGLLLGIVIDSKTFDLDGTLTEKELKWALIRAVGVFAGGAVGFLLTGGPIGLSIGAGLGAYLSVKLSESIINADGSLDAAKVGQALKDAMPIAGGAAIGFLTGTGPLGIALGAALGATLRINSVSFEEGESFGVEYLFQKLKPALVAATLGFLTIGGLKGAIIGVSAYAALTAIIKQFGFDSKVSAGDGKKNIEDLLFGIFGGLIGVKLGTSLVSGLGLGKGLNGTGAVVALTIGASLGLVINSVRRFQAGEITASALTVELLAALAPVVGGAILGWSLSGGNIVGAAIGMSVGLAISFVLRDMILSRENSAEFKMRAKLQKIEREIKSSKELNVNLKAKIDSITAEITEETTTDFDVARQLINTIFDLSDIPPENRTPEQTQQLIAAIETLNGMNISGVDIGFDDVTKSATGTRDAVLSVVDALDQQYRKEAYGQALVELYKAQAEAVINVSKALDAQKEAADAAAEAEANRVALENRGVGNDSPASYQWKLDAAKDAEAQAKAAKNEADQAVVDALTNYAESTTLIDNVNGMLADLVTDTTEKGKEIGENIDDGVADGTKENEDVIKDAAAAVADLLPEEMKKTLGIASPSKVMKEVGGYAIDGFEEGITEKEDTLVSTVEAVIDRITDAFRSGVEALKSIWHSDWGKPILHIPIFALTGMFDFATGRTPQISVRDWLWMARGGIVNGATPFIAGESGREAVIPLERNTEWVHMVAEGIVDEFMHNNSFADYITGAALPAIMSGSIVPPRALAGGGSILTEGDIDRLVSGLSAVFSGQQGERESVTKLYLDGREIAECVNKHNRQISMERGW